MTTSMTTQDTPRKLSKKEFKQIYWRSFTLLGSFNYERMEGLGFLYAMMPSLKRIWKDDPEGYKAALHRHIAAFNIRCSVAVCHGYCGCDGRTGPR